MDDSMYPVDAVRPLARTLRHAALFWHDADHRLVEKFAEDRSEHWVGVHYSPYCGEEGVF
jgi:hypothetical protein